MGRENADLESRKLYWAHPGESSVSSPLGFSRRLTELYSLSSRSPNLFISRVLSEEEKMHSIISSIHARVNLSVVVAVGTDRKGFVRQGHSQHNSPRSRLLWNKGKRSRPEMPKWFVVRESSLASSHFYSGTNRGSSLRVWFCLMVNEISRRWMGNSFEFLKSDARANKRQVRSTKDGITFTCLFCTFVALAKG